MGFTIDQVVPWGRNLQEYSRMFALTDADLDKKILGCADGPASFNAELYVQSKHCVSIDPVYQFSAQQIRARIEATATVIAEQMEKNRQGYVWNYYDSPEHLVKMRLAAMNLFLSDFDRGKKEGRYIEGALPVLPLADQSFDLVLCSHCLFTYSNHFDLDFHQQSIRDMCRVGKEVRIFPLLEVDGKRSRYLENIIDNLKKGHQIAAEIVEVPYEFQKGGSQMLLLQSK